MRQFTHADDFHRHFDMLSPRHAAELLMARAIDADAQQCVIICSLPLHAAEDAAIIFLSSGVFSSSIDALSANYLDAAACHICRFYFAISARFHFVYDRAPPFSAAFADAAAVTFYLRFSDAYFPPR